MRRKKNPSAQITQICLYKRFCLLYNLHYVKMRGVVTMNADFHRILTLLRKEKGVSQKQVAASLGISQALLSRCV